MNRTEDLNVKICDAMTICIIGSLYALKLCVAALAKACEIGQRPSSTRSNAQRNARRRGSTRTFMPRQTISERVLTTDLVSPGTRNSSGAAAIYRRRCLEGNALSFGIFLASRAIERQVNASM
jgi:hypothetical protein